MAATGRLFSVLVVLTALIFGLTQSQDVSTESTISSTTQSTSTQSTSTQSTSTQSTSTQSTSTQPTTTIPKSTPIMWSKQGIPNPQIDVYRCGRGGKASYVCDPENIFTTAQADAIDREIADLRRATSGCRCRDHDDCPYDPDYGGYYAAVAIVHRLRIKPNPSSSEKHRVSSDYAEYLRDDSWEFGRCHDDLVILISKEDRIVYTAVGRGVTHILEDACTTQIFTENRLYFTNGDFASGTIRLLEEYQKVLTGDRACGSGGGSTPTGAIIGVVVGIVVLVVIIVICVRCGCCKGGGGGGGSYHHSSHHFSSWGGGGGGSSWGGGGGGDGGGGGEF